MVKKKLLFEGKEIRIGDKGNIEEHIPVPVSLFLRKYFSASDYLEVKTSGSTGKPSLIRLKKEHMRNSAIKTLRFLNLSPGDRALLCMSTDHIAGIMMLVRWIEGGLDLYYLSPTSAPLSEELPDLEFAAMVPLQVQNSLKELNMVRKLIIGGAAISPALLNEIKKLKNEVYHTYGMTETISHIAMRRLSGSTASGYFRTLPGVEIGVDHRKCLRINAPDIGVNDLQTNDIVDLIDESGFVWLGRYDNVVNSGGIKLIPEDLEKKIGAIGFNFFLTGLPDENLGQKLVMVVEYAGPVENLNARQIFANLGKYERPKEILCMKEFERTSNGKLLRNQSLKRALGV